MGKADLKKKKTLKKPIFVKLITSEMAKGSSIIQQFNTQPIKNLMPNSIEEEWR